METKIQPKTRPSKEPKQIASIFSKPKQEVKKDFDPVIEITKKSEEKKRESSFLRLLKKKKMGIDPDPPVPTPESPVEGFSGESVLRSQGWRKGKELGISVR